MSTAEAQETSRLNMNSTEKFSKASLFQMIGLLDRTFNYETLKFERSLSLRLWCYFSLISKVIFGVKLFISYYFPKTDPIQLVIGSFFNYLPSDIKYFLGLVGIIIGTVRISETLFCSTMTMWNWTLFFPACWGVLFHFNFNYLKARNDNRLFRFWMKLTHELPEKSDRDYRVAGLSQEENQKFWSTVNCVNRLWFWMFNSYLTFMNIILCAPLFFVRFDRIEIFSVRYIFFQTLHVVNEFHSLYSFGHCCCSINLFFGECLWWFSRRFDNIERRVRKLNALEVSNRKKNRKLTKLVIEYQQVHYDLIMINDFFSSYIGFNLIGCLASGFIESFVGLLDIDWMWVKFSLKINRLLTVHRYLFRLKVFFSTTLLTLYLTAFYLPFFMAKSVTNEVNHLPDGI